MTMNIEVRVIWPLKNDHFHCYYFQVHDLKVSSHAFEGIHIGGAFTLKNTTLQVGQK
jgi:hypothetical protein